MRILAIDPGSEKSAWVMFGCGKVVAHGLELNEVIREKIYFRHNYVGHWHLAIEMVACYGMPVGAEVFDTCVWIGRFVEAWQPLAHSFVYRKDVKIHLCGSMLAKDSNIRQALIDRFGGKEKAIGKKATPGPLYGIKKDMWSALAVAVTFADTHADPLPVQQQETVT